MNVERFESAELSGVGWKCGNNEEACWGSYRFDCCFSQTDWLSHIRL
jgi:hypothetical protein